MLNHLDVLVCFIFLYFNFFLMKILTEQGRCKGLVYITWQMSTFIAIRGGGTLVQGGHPEAPLSENYIIYAWLNNIYICIVDIEPLHYSVYLFLQILNSLIKNSWLRYCNGIHVYLLFSENSGLWEEKKITLEQKLLVLTKREGNFQE